MKKTPIIITVEGRPFASALCECGERVEKSTDGSFKISTHLIEKHGFQDKELTVKLSSWVICPPRKIYEVTQ